ncbi:MAG: deaminase [bacterium]|nr:deaminase [bacterium]
MEFKNKSSKKKIILAYIPVLHEGYRLFLNKYRKNAELYILGQELIGEFEWLSKEIRALDPELIKKSVESWKLFQKIIIAGKNELKEIRELEKIIMPDEDVTREIAKKYFPKKKIIFDSIFLRWDKNNALKENTINPNRIISKNQFDEEFIKLAFKEAQKSSDWWRRVGAAIVKDGKAIIVSRNRHLPSDHMPYANGDPRNNFHKGDHIELSTAIHAEAAAIAEAAKKGISLEGSSMYVSTFPCPPCAKLVACSGIKKLYYTEGYGMLDGESILKNQGVEIIFVDAKVKIKKSLGDIPYEKRKR